MRLFPVLLGTAMTVTVAVPAAAQGTSAPTAFVGGLGGLTFGTATSSAIGGQVGVRIGRDIFVIGEIGRIQDVLPSSIADQIEEGIDFLEEQGVPVNIEFRAPATYGFGGIRWAQSGGGRVSPFVEGGAGFARLTGDVTGTIAGIDVSEFIEDELSLGDLSSTEFLVAVGGGANIGITSGVSVDAGYRFTRIFAEEEAPNTSMIYAAVKILFGR
jgi:opacity protein-like surface antigen